MKKLRVLFFLTLKLYKLKTIKRVRIKFDKFLHDTGKAILIRIGNTEYWLAHYMCNNLVVNNKLGGHVSLSVDVCKEKGIYYSEDMADYIITRHIPKKVTKKIIHDKSLKR